MKIDLNFNLKGLSGEDIRLADRNGNLLKDENGNFIYQNAGKIVGNLLGQAKSDNPMKYSDWALTLYRGEPLEIDKTDCQWLQEFIKKSDALNDWNVSQILNRMNEKKEPERANGKQ